MVEFDAWDLTETDILVEWQSIDVLIRSVDYGFACVIENKIWSKEHSEQLQRYRELVDYSFPGKNLYVYLTPEGDEPTDDNYVSLTYSDILSLLDILLSTPKQINDDVLTLVNHYKLTVERDITQSDRIKELSRKLYRKHKRALETVMQEAGSLQSTILDIMATLVKGKPELELEQPSPTIVRFVPKKFDILVPKNGTGGWMKSKQILVFEAKYIPNRFALHLYIGPGDAIIRGKIFAAAQKSGKSLFNTATTLYDKYTEIYRRVILDEKELKELYPESNELEPKIRKEFDEFVKGDLQKIIAAIPKIEQ